MKFSRAIEYFERFNENKYAERSMELYTGHLNRFCEFMQDKEIEDIHLFDDVLDYQKKMKDEGKKDNTINLAMVSIRQVFIMLHNMERQLNITVPFTAGMIPVKRNVKVKSHEPITERQFNDMISAVQNNHATTPFIRIRDEAVIRVLYDSGMRVGELVSLNYSDLNLQRRSIEVMTSKRKDRNRKREVYWTQETDSILRKYLVRRLEFTTEDHLFISHKSKNRIDSRTVQRIVREYTKKIGLTDTKITPHSFRHGLGMRAVKNRMYPPLLQAYLGHKNPASSQVYYNLQNDDLREEFMAKM